MLPTYRAAHNISQCLRRRQRERQIPYMPIELWRHLWALASRRRRPDVMIYKRGAFARKYSDAVIFSSLRPRVTPASARVNPGIVWHRRQRHNDNFGVSRARFCGTQ